MVGNFDSQHVACKLHPLLNNHVTTYGYLTDRDTAMKCLAIAPDETMTIESSVLHSDNSGLIRSLYYVNSHATLIAWLPGSGTRA